MNDGGPAFPSGPSGCSHTGETGMTVWQFPAVQGMSLRDWLAGQALAGILAERRRNEDEAAEEAYRHADFMLAERSKT